MVTIAKGDLSFLPAKLWKILNHRISVFCITAALAIWVAWLAGSLVWKLWLLNDETSQASTFVPLASKNTQPKSLKDLLQYPLIRSASTSSTDSASLNAPETSLKLKLVGLMYSTDQNQARAIIENGQDGALSYATHERVADNAEIHSIEPDRVILLHAGRKEALFLDPDNKVAVAQTGTENQPPGSSGSARTTTRSQPAASQGSMRPPRNTAELMREFSATPVMEDGELLGFQLKALRNPEILQQWGIGQNDVITAVNGIALNAPGRVMVLYDKLKKQREFEITLSSGGNRRTITVDLYE
ncbi:MAG: type II secretion system protein GspC [Xanthomonadales bacterium]|nr:type II secretion system protein GspC [Xanthomonadales bacterium]